MIYGETSPHVTVVIALNDNDDGHDINRKFHLIINS